MSFNQMFSQNFSPDTLFLLNFYRCNFVIKYYYSSQDLKTFSEVWYKCYGRPTRDMLCVCARLRVVRVHESHSHVEWISDKVHVNNLGLHVHPSYERTNGCMERLGFRHWGNTVSVFVRILIPPPVRFQAILKIRNKFKGKRNNDMFSCEIRARNLCILAEVEFFPTPPFDFMPRVRREYRQENVSSKEVVVFCAKHRPAWQVSAHSNQRYRTNVDVRLFDDRDTSKWKLDSTLLEPPGVLELGKRVAAWVYSVCISKRLSGRLATFSEEINTK